MLLVVIVCCGVDIRALCCNCLSRGELEAPRILLAELSRCEGLTSQVIVYYITTCLAAGQPLADVIADLETDIDVKKFPEVLATPSCWGSGLDSSGGCGNIYGGRCWWVW